MLCFGWIEVDFSNVRKDYLTEDFLSVVDKTLQNMGNKVYEFINSLSLVGYGSNFKGIYLKFVIEIVTWVHSVKLHPGEYHRTLWW